MLKKFVRELRRREVFRATGLYVGICWLLIEVSSTVLPTFDAPDWIVRAIIIVSILGFPVAVVLAWIYDFTDHGIVVQADPTDTVVPPVGSRKMDFVVIGILSVALMVSVYLNVTGRPGDLDEPQKPVSVLIADFDNTTGDPVFDGSIEQALQIGLEGASFITTFPRASAERAARTLQPGSMGLSAELARLVSVREGINVMLDGEIRTDGDGYELIIRATDGVAGEELISASADADSKLEVLSAVNALTGEVREALGDKGVDGRVMVKVDKANTPYTIWWIVFNRPRHCAGYLNVPKDPCGLPDLFNPLVQAAVFNASGAISAAAGEGGVINVDVELIAGEGSNKGHAPFPPFPPGSGLPDINGVLKPGNGCRAEIHMEGNEHADFNADWVEELTQPEGVTHRFAIFPAVKCSANPK